MSPLAFAAAAARSAARFAAAASSSWAELDAARRVEGTDFEAGVCARRERIDEGFGWAVLLDADCSLERVENAEVGKVEYEYALLVLADVDAVEVEVRRRMA